MKKENKVNILKSTFITTVKPLKRGHLRLLKNLSVIKRCPLLGGSLTEIVTFGTKHFVRYLGCPLLRGFTVCTILFLSQLFVS